MILADLTDQDNPISESDEHKSHATLKSQKTSQQILGYLTDTYPKVFNVNFRKPLKVCIYKDILERMSDPKFSVEEIKRALKQYYFSHQYQLSLTKNKYRFDLDNNKAGEVLEHEKKNAVKLLAIKGFIKK